MFHDGSRSLQDEFQSRPLADRLVDVLARGALSDDQRAFIESRSMFFLATADADGRPDCSYKGGAPGFVRALDAQTIVFPNYDGNGMFKSLGNIIANAHVGLLFIDLEHPKRLRVNGRATVELHDELMASFPGANCVVRVHTQAVFPNCPRYIHTMHTEHPSEYVPAAGYTPPEPGWKQRPEFREVLPPTK